MVLKVRKPSLHGCELLSSHRLVNHFANIPGGSLATILSNRIFAYFATTFVACELAFSGTAFMYQPLRGISSPAIIQYTLSFSLAFSPCGRPLDSLNCYHTGSTSSGLKCRLSAPKAKYKTKNLDWLYLPGFLYFRGPDGDLQSI
jgi:hypothetical protein